MLVVAAALFSSGTPALAQWAQQWLPLSTGQAAGGGVALSADGSTAIVGAIAAPWVYTRTFNNLFGYIYQQGPQLLGFSNDPWYSVALSADGNTAIVGTPQDGSSGSAWLFTRSGGTWTLLQKEVGSGGASAGQGRSVALSADGSTAIVGALVGPGAWIFIRTQTSFGSIWAQQGQKLVGSGGGAGTGPAAFQTLSVGLSADGNTAIVGNGSSIGEAWVFTRSGATWTEQQRLVVDPTSTSSTVTTHVALSADGNTAIVGGPVDIYGNDAAWVFTRSGGTWTEQQELALGGAFFRGVSVALSADGNTAIVGRGGDNAGAGQLWVFARSGGAWTQQQMLVGSEAIINRHLGTSVALSADGNIAIAGAREANGGTNNAWVFVQTPTVAGVNGPFVGIAGEHVTIKGTGFTGATAVTFGGAAAGNLVVLDPNTIKVTTPPHAPGTVDVAVTNSIGTGIGHGLYTYLKIVPVLP
ncbi:MAG TPA: IPT/TIG domain-containing protein [Hyphomicrobiaceae bacterium]|nr:IPT/TIG domain-containing protein [Hyphomicrobiaceae bacterium]